MLDEAKRVRQRTRHGRSRRRRRGPTSRVPACWLPRWLPRRWSPRLSRAGGLLPLAPRLLSRLCCARIVDTCRQSYECDCGGDVRDVFGSHGQLLRRLRPAVCGFEPSELMPPLEACRRREPAGRSCRRSRRLALGYSEKTNSIPPQLVHRARSGSVEPRSRTSYGRFAATSPAMSRPMSPPIPV